jgi:hypothetical protein
VLKRLRFAGLNSFRSKGLKSYYFDRTGIARSWEVTAAEGCQGPQAPRPSCLQRDKRSLEHGRQPLILGNALNYTKLWRNSAAGNEPARVKKKEKTMLEQRI